MLGRVVDPLGEPLDGGPALDPDHPSREGRHHRPGHRRPSAGERAAADRHQGDRLDDPDRPRPARADHRRPQDRQDRRRVDTIINQKQYWGTDRRRGLHLRRGRPEGIDRGGRRRDARSTARWTTPSSSTPRPSDPAPMQYIAPTPAARWASTSCGGKGKASTPSASTTTCPSRPWRTASSRCCCVARRVVRPTPATCSTCTAACSSARPSSPTRTAAAR
jgi:hypothetical protein